MKISRIAAVGLITATIAVGGFAGCGGSSSSSGSDTAAAADTTAADTTAADTTGGGTEAEFVAAANQVCTDGIAALEQATASADAGSLEGMQAAFQTAADTSRQMLTDLQAIEPPAGLADAYQAFLTAEETSVTAAEDLATKVAAETDITAAQKDAAEVINAEAGTAAAVSSAAKAAGLDACAGKGSGSSDGTDG